MIPRHNLPQIAKEKLPEFVRFLDSHGVGVEKGTVRARDLKPIQKSVNKEKVKSMLQGDKSSLRIPILITKDHHIIDGHHRWLASLVNGDKNIKCIILQCSLKHALNVMSLFDGSEFKSVHEISVYGRNALLNEHLPEDFIVRKTLWHANEGSPLDAAPIEVGDSDDADNLLNKDGYGYTSKYTDYGAGMVPGTM